MHSLVLCSSQSALPIEALVKEVPVLSFCSAKECVKTTGESVMLKLARESDCCVVPAHASGQTTIFRQAFPLVKPVTTVTLRQ